MKRREKKTTDLQLGSAADRRSSMIIRTRIFDLTVDAFTTFGRQKRKPLHQLKYSCSIVNSCGQKKKHWANRGQMQCFYS